jgi:hypothetical protein
MKMIKKHYAVFDTTAQHFLNTIVFINHSDAIRWFTSVVNDEKKETNIAKYPQQFMLFYMYDMDDKTGMTGTYNEANQKLEKQEPPKELILGASCQEEQNRSFTVNDLVTMLKSRLDLDNVVEITQDEVKNK